MHNKYLDNRSSLNQKYTVTHLQPLYKSSNETQPVINLRQKLQIAYKKLSLTQYKQEA